MNGLRKIKLEEFKEALMRKVSSTFWILLLLITSGVLVVSAQDVPKPLPTPTPKPVPTQPTPDPSNTSDSDGKDQGVVPEKIVGVPDIQIDYENDDIDLPPLGRVGVNMLEQRLLTVREAVVMALSNNKDIEVSRKDIELAELQYKSSTAIFAGRITGTSVYNYTKSPNASIFNQDTSVTNNVFSNQVTFSDTYETWGTQFSATFNSSRTTTSNPLSTLSPQYDSSMVFQIVQPLFRGRKIDDARRGIEIAKQNVEITDTQFRKTATETAATVEKAYWDLVFALRNLQVQRDSVRDAKAQLEHNKRLVEEGVLAPIDIVAAKTQVANFEQNVYASLEVVNTVENLLKNLIASSVNDPLWDEAILPVDSVELPPPNTSLTDAMATAYENRLEFKILDQSLAANEIDQAYYENQKKPEINLIASYTSSGIAGTANPNATSIFSSSGTSEKINEVIDRVNALDTTLTPIALLPIVVNPGIPDAITGGYFSSLGDIFANRYPSFQIGVSFGFSTNSDAQDAALGASLVQQEKLTLQQEQFAGVVKMDVRNSLQAIRTARGKLRTATIARTNSEEQYASEQRKLEAGLSDIYKVLERQTALMVARSSELQARTDLNKAIVDFHRSTGTTLKNNNLETLLNK